MDNILTRIIATKAEEVAAAKASLPLAELKDKCKDLAPTHSLKASLLSHAEGGIIAEFKRRSPSKDWIKREAKVADINYSCLRAGWRSRTFYLDRSYLLRWLPQRCALGTFPHHVAHFTQGICN